MKTWRIWLLSLLLLPWAACAEHLRLVADSWPPFTDQRLAGNGVAAELVGTALSRAGYTSDYREVPWQRAVLGLQRGDYDVLITAWYSREREAFGYFSAPYLVNRIRVVQRKGAGIVFNQLADLHAHQIAVRRGYAYSPAFMADDQLQTVEVSSFENAARMVHRGRVTLALEDEYVARFLFGNSLKAIADDLEFLPMPLSENGLHILIRLTHGEHAEIARRFDAAIAAMQADGSYGAIMARYGLQ
ncbi:transporter substrate-binding domain-containing protein [Pseudomonas fulva]|uniref:substrate-binding periplasmic protein n=1 Tax=Pseudomonas fulva TaxID=47880 RepID=UPI00201DF440|nr:transporter substrate-binding domain-containing protein [Pseudomonas fulva]UQY36404.1 transporter substrate-binding domain-containing protein [Pseudomonas fulva]